MNALGHAESRPSRSLPRPFHSRVSVMLPLSPLRAKLASFEHAYALAIRLRRTTGIDQYIVRTGDPLQPVRVMHQPPEPSEWLLARVL